MTPLKSGVFGSIEVIIAKQVCLWHPWFNMACGDNDIFEYIKCASSGNATAETKPLNSVGDFLGIAINVLLGTVLAASMISIIWSGIKFITAQGDPKAKGTAQKALTYSVVAFLLGIGAFTFKAIIFNLLGVNQGDLINATPGF